MKISIVIPGKPMGQPRPRFARIGNGVRTYDKAEAVNYKAYVKYLAQSAKSSAGWDLTDEPIEVFISAFLGIPASKSKKFKEQAQAGLIYPTTKPDFDNIAKIVTDAISGIIYNDDKQIIHCDVRKQYAVEPRVEITIYKAASA